MFITGYPHILRRKVERSIKNMSRRMWQKRKQITTNLKVFGGAFDLDRVLINNEKQVVTNQLVFQMDQKIKAVRALFNDWFVNGDSTTDQKAFDGLNKAIKDTNTDHTLKTVLDMSSAEAIEKNWKAFLYYIRQTLKLMDGTPDIMVVNDDMFAVFQTVADYSAQFTATKSDLGSEIVTYGNTKIMKMGINQENQNRSLRPAKRMVLLRSILHVWAWMESMQ